MIRSDFLLLAIFSICFLSTDGYTQTIKMGGFVATQFVNDESEDANIDNQWKFRHARMHIKGNVNNKLNGFVQIETKAGVATLQNAFVNLMYLPNTEIRMGYIKLPFGLEAYGHPLKNPTIDISLASKKVYCPIGIHDMGIHMKYEHRVATCWVALVNGNNGTTVDNNSCKDFCGRLLFTHVKGLGFGGSYSTGKITSGTNKYGVEINYKNGPLWARGEYLDAKDEQVTGDDKEYMGYYASFAYKFLPQVEGAVKYGACNPNTKTDNDEWSNITMGLIYYLAPKGWNRVLLNYEIRNDKANENLGNLLTAQLQVLF